MDSVRTGLSFDDVLLVPKRSPVEHRSHIDLSATVAGDVTVDVPILSAAMDTVTEKALAAELSRLGGLGVIHRFQEIGTQASQVAHVKADDEQVAAAIGVNEEFLERAGALVEAGADVLVVDIAHAHSDACLAAVERLRDEFPNTALMVGNIATAAAARDLIEAGVDSIKVGVGPGSHCTTRRVTGAGVPQLTAISDCASACKGEGVTVVADGGIRSSGDIVKALMAGADTVMIGGLLAGTKEAPGDVVEVDGEKYKMTRGMASEEANEERTDKEDVEVVAPEGEEGLTPYDGGLAGVIEELAFGVRSGVSYCGGLTVDEARRQAEFIRTLDGAQSRETVHGVVKERE